MVLPLDHNYIGELFTAPSGKIIRSISYLEKYVHPLHGYPTRVWGIRSIYKVYIGLNGVPVVGVWPKFREMPAGFSNFDRPLYGRMPLTCLDLREAPSTRKIVGTVLITQKTASPFRHSKITVINHFILVGKDGLSRNLDMNMCLLLEHSQRC